MQVDADSLGSYLRREREMQQVSLQDISAATKIQLRFLKALEDDAYDQLPPAPFVVGFLRAYAHCLSLDPEDIVSVYHAQYGTADKLEGQRSSAEVQQLQQPAQYNRKRVSLFVGLAIVVLLGSFIWQFARRGEDINPITSSVAGNVERISAASSAESEAMNSSPETPPSDLLKSIAVPEVDESTSQEPIPAIPLQGAAQDLSASAVVDSVSGEQQPTIAEVDPGPDAREALLSDTSAPAQEITPAAVSTSLVLQVIAEEDTWLRVEIDDAQRHSLLLISGKSIQWEADERFTLTVGNAHGTRLSLNGRDIPLPPTRNNVVRDFVLTRSMVN